MNPTVIRHDRYYSYAELTTALETLVATHPTLARLDSIGRTFGGRDIWVVEITNPATGPAEHKPGFYIDAHIHAEEHVTSSVALYATWYLLSRYGLDEEVTRLVDAQVFYILPRLNPDGAELSLRPPYHRWVGNGRFQPGQERERGIIPQDLNDDGYIVHMRIPDPLGEWKKSSRDPRLLVQRAPDEQDGEYFRLYPEGLIRDFDGVDVTIERPRDGNLNRNFPIGWRPEFEQYGAGEHPLSEPEIRALVQFILDHPNIAGMSTYHSHGGVILRPSMTKPDSAMAPPDLTLYQDLGAIGTNLTGYPTISVFEDFTPDKTRPRRGGFEDWSYETLGIICFGPELWDIEREAGAEKTSFFNLYPRDEEAQHTIFTWVLEHCGKQGFRDWERFDHPQLGPVEIGGMVDIWTFRNPPPELLEQVCLPHVLFNLKHAAAAPAIRVDRVQVGPVGSDLFRVEAFVANHGYLPTNLSDVAIQNGVAEPVIVELELEGADLVMNPARVSLGHLAGRNERNRPWSPFGQQWSATTGRVEWLIRRTDRDRASLRVTAHSPRAGRHQRRVALR